MSDASDERRDLTPRRQPIFNVPGPILATLAILIGIHAIRQILPADWDDAVFLHLAFVPGRLTFAVAPERVAESLMALAGQGAEGYRQAQMARFFIGQGGPELWTIVSYGLLHADWGHVGLNAVWLLAFGTPLARRCGPWRFVLFMGVAALAGAVVQWAAHPMDFMPVIGASAAVSGCMGAALRFMFQPDVPMTVLLGETSHDPAQASTRPAQPLAQAFRDRRALTFLVAWFFTNLLFGVGSMAWGLSSGPIAWEAHIGGFLAGLLLFRLFDPIGPSSGHPSSVDVEPAATDVSAAVSEAPRLS